MARPLIVNTIAATLGTLVAAGAMLASVRVMHMPKSPFFVAVLLLSGAIVWIFVFFLVWGHFQEANLTAKKSEDASSGKPES